MAGAASAPSVAAEEEVGEVSGEDTEEYYMDKLEDISAAESDTVYDPLDVEPDD